jgi:hypothetical protein
MRCLKSLCCRGGAIVTRANKYKDNYQRSFHLAAARVRCVTIYLKNKLRHITEIRGDLFGI